MHAYPTLRVPEEMCCLDNGNGEGQGVCSEVEELQKDAQWV